MELLSVIRRWALRDQLSIREIARRTGLSRNTIRKYCKRWLQTTFAQGSSWSSFDMGQCWAILVRVSVK